MRRFLPLHPERLLLYTALLTVLIVQTSCGSEREIRASIDGSNEKEGGDSQRDNDYNVGFNAGIAFFLGMPGSHASAAVDEPEPANANRWALCGQVEFVQKGSKIESSTTKLSYLNLVGDVLYQYSLSNNGVLYGGAGPYVGYGLGGHVKAGDTKEPAFGSDGYKRFDAGLHLTAGYRLPMGLSLNLAYEWGLINKSRFDDFTSRNRTYSFQVGYSLDKIIAGFKK